MSCQSKCPRTLQSKHETLTKPLPFSSHETINISMHSAKPIFMHPRHVSLPSDHCVRFWHGSTMRDMCSSFIPFFFFLFLVGGNFHRVPYVLLVSRITHVRPGYRRTPNWLARVERVSRSFTTQEYWGF